jgi:hypothetical protein
MRVPKPIWCWEAESPKVSHSREAYGFVEQQAAAGLAMPPVRSSL